MVCQDNRLVMEVKQGEDRGFGFTILQDDEPMDLTDWTVVFQVKLVPYFSAPALIEKEITTDSSSKTRDIGYILDQTESPGQFKVEISKEETTKLPPKDYALIIFLTNGSGITASETRVIISGESNNAAIFRVCKQ